MRAGIQVTSLFISECEVLVYLEKKCVFFNSSINKL
jgi:hypothetical protein